MLCKNSKFLRVFSSA